MAPITLSLGGLCELHMLMFRGPITSAELL